MPSASTASALLSSSATESSLFAARAAGVRGAEVLEARWCGHGRRRAGRTSCGSAADCATERRGATAAARGAGSGVALPSRRAVAHAPQCAASACGVGRALRQGAWPAGALRQRDSAGQIGAQRPQVAAPARWPPARSSSPIDAPSCGSRPVSSSNSMHAQRVQIAARRRPRRRPAVRAPCRPASRAAAAAGLRLRRRCAPGRSRPA